MQRANRTTISTLVLVGCMAVLVIWVALGSSSPMERSGPQSLAEVPQGVAQQGLPNAVGTEEPPVPEITPTIAMPTSTPTPKIWSLPIEIPGITIAAMDQDSQNILAQKSAVNLAFPITQLIWAPIGDKVLYVTQAGDLYWSDPNGGNDTLLHQYGESYDQLEDQMPMTNTLLIRHLGAPLPLGGRGPSHLDAIKFTPGQAPIVQQGPDLPHPPHKLHWWSTDRASGIAHTDYEAGDLLVTVDGNGNLVSEVNVPHMLNGVVRPGGGWLAYATNGQTTVNVDSTDPQTIYLLNLNTGERKRVTAPGKGGAVISWSPDGNWFLIGTPDLGMVIVSADGQQWLTIPDGSPDAVWSRDSTRLAFATVKSAESDGHDVTSWTGSTAVVNVPERKVSTDSEPGSSPMDPSTVLMWKPRWSPNGSLLTFLSFDPQCPFYCSGTLPAYYHMTLP